MKLNGAKIVMEVLLEEGVNTVFGYPGGNVLGIYDALYKYRKHIHHILTAHEQGAAHAADGYARISGRTGVCFATSGPGATNLVTGIATAYMDSSPIVFITGNASSELIGRDAFQEADTTGITIPITKNNYMVKDIHELADTLREAFYVAKSGRPGPVLVDIPMDIASACCDFQKKPKALQTVSIEGDLNAAQRLIQMADAPVLLIGGGAHDARDDILHIAEVLKCPVVSTMMGLGILPDTHPQFYGMLGVHGKRAANMAVSAADLVIAIGTRFSDRILDGELSSKPILHIDIDRAEINKNLVAIQSIVGDAHEVLSRLAVPRGTAWFQYTEDTDDEVMVDMMQKLGAAFSDAIIVTEVGEHQIACAKYFPFTAKNRFLTSGGFGTMGFGLGAAIGAAMAEPGRRILHIAGDGSFRMNLGELATVSRLKLPITTIIVDNQALGMVRTMQDIQFNGRHSESELGACVDYIKIAEAFGIPGQELPENVMDLKAGIYHWKLV